MYRRVPEGSSVKRRHASGLPAIILKPGTAQKVRTLMCFRFSLLVQVKFVRKRLQPTVASFC